MAPFLLANFLATLHFVFYLWGGFAPRIGTVQNTMSQTCTKKHKNKVGEVGRVRVTVKKNY